MPSIQIESAIGLVRAWLLSSAGIVAVVGGRIVGGYTETPDVGTIGRPCVVIRSLGAPRSYQGVIGELTLEIVAISAVSAAEARALYDLVFDRLQSEGLSVPGHDHRGLIRETEGGREGYWEKGRSYLVRGGWRLSVVRDTP
jgi:hypothetical protein